MLSCRTLEDADEARKAAELKEKEDADVRKAEEERQKELEEARRVVELKERKCRC